MRILGFRESGVMVTVELGFRPLYSSILQPQRRSETGTQLVQDEHGCSQDDPGRNVWSLENKLFNFIAAEVGLGLIGFRC